MKKSTIKIRFASLLVLILFLGVGFFYLFIFLRCFIVADSVPYFSKVSLMRVMIYGRSNETVSARISILNTRGHEVAILDRSWSGQNLVLEFSSANFNDKEYLFPYRLYSEKYDASTGKKKIYNGTKLSRYYIYDGDCVLLDSSYSDKENFALYSLAVFADLQASKFQSKFSKIYSLNLSAFRDGETYEIETDFKGNLSFSRM